MAPNQTRLLQKDFFTGFWRDTARHLIPENGVYDLRNYLLDEDGMPYKRGGTVNKSNTNFGASLRAIWDLYLDAGQRTLFANASDFGVLSSDDQTPVNLGSDGLAIPRVATAVAGMVFIGGGYIYAGSRKTSSNSAGTVTTTNGSRVVTGAGTGWASNLDAGMLFQIGNERVYVIDSVDSATQITLRNEIDLSTGAVVGYEGTTGGGKSYTAYPLYKITAPDPYPTADFYAVCGNRLIVSTDNFVNASEPGKPHDYSATIGGKNIATQHELPEGVSIVGFGVIEQTLLVFSTGGTWTITGLPFNIVDATGAPLQQLSLLSRDFIALNPEGVATWNQYLVVPTSDGIYLLDGVSQPKKISRPIERLYREYVRLGYLAGQAIVHQGHYFLPIITSAGASKDVLVCRIDRPVTVRGETVYPWSRLSGQGGSIIAFAQRIGLTTRSPILMGADRRISARVLDCSRFFTPGGDVALDADDTAFESDIITRDYETGNMTENMVRWVRINHQLIDAGSDDPTIVVGVASDLADPDSPQIGHPDGVFGLGFGPAKNGVLQPFTASVESQFRSLCEIPEDYDGTHPHRCRVNQSARFVRFRLRSDDPCAVHRLRALEVAIRPSKAIRR
jgi:hypothetical protein